MNCDRHGSQLLPVSDAPGTLCCIAGCIVTTEATLTERDALSEWAGGQNGRDGQQGGASHGVAEQLKLAMEPGRQRNRVKPLEKDVQAGIVAGLRARGYIVLETGVPKRKRPCPKCEHWHVQPGGNNAPGVPDILAYHPRLTARGHLMAFEVKSHRAAKRSREQVRLAEVGAIVVVWSWEMVEAVLRGAGDE